MGADKIIVIRTTAAKDAESGWREIEVEVSVPGLEVRSARGRYP